MVDPSEDNMLKICHDAKLVSTDVRLLDLTAEPDPNGKLYRCAERVYELWQQSANEKGAQVIFSDIGVPNGDKSFNVYQFIKDELIKREYLVPRFVLYMMQRMIKTGKICSRM